MRLRCETKIHEIFLMNFLYTNREGNSLRRKLPEKYENKETSVERSKHLKKRSSIVDTKGLH